MAEAVVDVLEPVEVGNDERERPAESLQARELRGERLLALAPVREAGEAVDQRLTLHDPMQPGVVERNDGMRGKRDRRHAVLVLELVGEEQQRAEVRLAGSERHLDLLGALARLAGLYELAADRDDHASGRARRLDRGLDDETHQLVDVVRRTQRL